MKISIADRLNEAMQRYGLRQVDILKRAEPYCTQYQVKLGRNDLSQYVSGKVTPGPEKLTVLALALGVSETWLMGYDVPMERKTSDSRSALCFDARLEAVRDMLERDGYSLSYSAQPDDGVLTIKNSTGEIVACSRDYELVNRYEALQRRGSVTADSLLLNATPAFLSYLDSLGYHLYTDSSECEPVMVSKAMRCRLEHDTLASLKLQIDHYAKATIDSAILSLKEKELRKKRLEKEHLVRLLNVGLAAAHERTDIEVTGEMTAHDDNIMNDDDEWK